MDDEQVPGRGGAPVAGHRAGEGPDGATVRPPRAEAY